MSGHRPWRDIASARRPHPLNNCGPLALAMKRDEACPTCGVLAGHVPTADELARIREVWPTYPSGFWA